MNFIQTSQTLSQLASLQFRPDPSAETLTAYQGLPVACHHMEEATYDLDSLGVDVVADWVASLHCAPRVIHINLRRPTHNSYFFAQGPRSCGGNSDVGPPLCAFCIPPPLALDQLLRGLGTNLVGKTKDAHVRVYPTTNLLHTPPLSRHDGSSRCE